MLWTNFWFNKCCVFVLFCFFVHWNTDFVKVITLFVLVLYSLCQEHSNNITSKHLVIFAK